LLYRTLHAVGISEARKRLQGGGCLVLQTSDAVSQRIACEDAFEPEMRAAFLRHAARSTNILDIGANIGYYTVLATQIMRPGGRVFCFEPQPAVLSRLRRNIAVNALQNVVVYDCALCERNGSTQFCVPADGYASHGSILHNERVATKEVITVSARRLDDVLAELGNPAIDLMKLDVEGAEKLVLEGGVALLSSSARPVILFEAHEGNTSAFGYTVFDLLQKVHAFGYTLRQLDHENWLALPHHKGIECNQMKTH
jgi:FkbM family methyltransferase